jgi:hypothetical protein
MWFFSSGKAVLWPDVAMGRGVGDVSIVAVVPFPRLAKEKTATKGNNPLPEPLAPP